MVEATRKINDIVSTQRCYYISSLPPETRLIALAIRSHWRIENSMHWVLDVAFGEDQCRVRVENAAQDFAILRRIALHQLKRDTKTRTRLQNCRLKACASYRYRTEILSW